MKLEIKGISKRYKDKLALNNVDLNLTPGVYGLVGKNGAGKTTLIHIMISLLKPTSGKIFFNGENIFTLGEKYRDIIGFLPQDFGYNPEMTVKNYLEYIGVLKGITGKKLQKGIDEVLDFVSLSENKSSKLKKLSGGMIRKVGIAQAMMNNPKILILDEPTAGLDPIARINFRNILSSYSDKNIVLISSHIISDISSVAQKIIFLENGNILTWGRIDAILNSVKTKAWEELISAEDLNVYEKNTIITNKSIENDKVKIKYLKDTPLSSKAIGKELNLEDAFVWYATTL